MSVTHKQADLAMAGTANRETFWRRLMQTLTAFSEAAEMTYDDFQDRRIERLVGEVEELRAQVALLLADRRSTMQSTQMPTDGSKKP